MRKKIHNMNSSSLNSFNSCTGVQKFISPKTRHTRLTPAHGFENSQPEPLFSHGEYGILNREHRRKRFWPAELAFIVEIKKIFHATITGVVEKPERGRKSSS
jgi:hypothetical protein